MQVKHKCFTVCIDTDCGFKGFCRIVLFPTAQHVEMLNLTYTEELHKCDHTRKIKVVCSLIQRSVGKGHTQIKRISGKIDIRNEIVDLSGYIIFVEKFTVSSAEFNYHRTLFGKVFEFVIKCDNAHMNIFFLSQNFFYHFSSGSQSFAH